MDILVNKHCYFPSPDTSIVTLILQDWVTGRIIELMSGPQTIANKKSLAKFQAVDVNKMMMEPPTLYKDNKMLVCVLSRKAGTMWIDQVIDKLKWDRFLKQVDPNNKFNSLQTATPGIATKEDLLTLSDTLVPVDPVADIFLSNLEGTTDKALIFTAPNSVFTPEIFLQAFLKGYRFDEIKVTIKTKTDSDYPKLDGTLMDLCVGEMEIVEDLVFEGKVTYKIFSLPVIKDLKTPPANPVYDGSFVYDGTLTY